MLTRKVLCLLLVLVGVSIADTIWGPVPLSEPDTVLPKAYPAADANDNGEYAVAWFDCRDGGWPTEVRWFSRYLGRVDKNGSALAPNRRLDPPGWITEQTGRNTDVLLFDDGSCWTLTFTQSNDAMFCFWGADDELDTELELVGVSNEWSWAKTGNGEAVLGEGSGGALDLWFLSKGSLDTTVELGVVGTSPQIAADDNGDILIAYENEGEVYWLRCDAGGEIITDPVHVSPGYLGDIVCGGQGRLVVTWKTWQYFGYPQARVYLKAGNPIGDVQVLDTETCRGRPAAASSNQRFLVTWVRGDGDEPHEVMASIMNSNGDVVVPPIEISERIGGIEEFYEWCWAYGDDEGYTVMWLQDNHVYGKRLNEGGGLVTGPYTVNDDEPGSVAGWSEVVLAPDGSGFIAWAPYDNHEFYHGVRLRHFSQNGTGGGLWHGDSTENPSIALTPDGGAWMSYGVKETKETGRIMLQRFDNQGNPIGEEITVFPDREGKWGKFSFNTAVAVHSNGEGVVVWPQDDDVWGQLINSNGAPKGNPFVAMADVDLRNAMEVQCFDDGGFVVTAEDYGTRVRTRLFNSYGMPQGDVFFADSGWVIDGHSLATDGRDHFVVLWQATGSEGYTEAYFSARVFDRNGERVSPIITDTVLSPNKHWLRDVWHFSPAVTMNSTGNWVVAWTEALDANLENPMVVRGQMYDRDGNKLGARFSIPDTFPGYERFQGTNSLAAAGGKLLYTWYGSADHRGVEVYGLLTDWPTPPAITEEFTVSPANWYITQSVGPQITLQYSNSPQGFHANIFDVTGRKVDELHSDGQSGTITWGECYGCYGPGVYFIRDESDSPKTHKVVLIQ